jgi:hypothetical protein
MIISDDKPVDRTRWRPGLREEKRAQVVEYNLSGEPEFFCLNWPQALEKSRFEKINVNKRKQKKAILLSFIFVYLPLFRRRSPSGCICWGMSSVLTSRRTLRVLRDEAFRTWRAATAA